MNIFVLDENPIEAAKRVPVKGASKMALEAAQMLAVACHKHGLSLPHKKDGNEYSPNAHVNHPCTKWTYQSKSNMKWLVLHAKELCLQHFMKYDRIPAHSSALNEILRQLDSDVRWENHTPFVCAMPDEYKQDDAISSYRSYIKTKPYYVEN